MERRRIASVDAVRVRIGVAYLIICWYCWAMSSQRIGRVSAGISHRYASGSPTTGRHSFTLEVIRLPINGLVGSNRGLDRVIAVRSVHGGRASR